MTRSGVDKTQVESARDSLVAQGKHPSVDAVRVALGNTGSKSTIHRYLKELENEAPAATSVALSEPLQHLVGQLVARLQAEAETRIADAQARCDAAVENAAHALADQEREGRSLSDRLQHTETALQEASRAHEDAKCIFWPNVNTDSDGT